MSELNSPSEGGPGDLGAKVNHGLRWSAANQVVNRILTFASGVVVLRILSVESVGTFGAAFAIVTLILAVNELGLIPTMVQWSDRPEHTGRTAYTLALASSVFWFMLVMVTAPWLSELIGIAGLTVPLRIIAITILVDGVTSVPNAFVMREFRQRGLAIAETLGMFVQIGVSIGLAVAGAGAAALAWGQTLSNAVAGAVLVLFVAPRIVPGWDRTVVKPLLRFSTSISAAALVRDGGVNADSLVVGGTLGATQLGYYQLAFNLGSLPVNLIGATISRVSLAGFARLGTDRDRMREALRRSTMYLLAITVPMVALIAALAGPIVAFVYGPKWAPAVEALRFLVVLGGLRVLVMLLLDMCIADGRPRVELVAFGVWLVILLPAIWIGARTHGIVGAAVVHVAVMAAVVLPIVLRALQQSGLHPAGALRASIRPLVAGTVAGAAAYATSLWFGRSLVQIIVGGVVGLLVMAVGTLPGNHDLSWNSLRRWRGQLA
ncbi:MAG: oligosaccharide flippase family protein [Acidimicrobiia bacterium]